ncbi:SDR family NAD(P)-dependent oxidoreductase [Lignipirellula cremea]|uniref:3-oxoacyl-[acyl-carrier-protein] reductase FabG n=1 Tax=Lignipirellula cremea TaxID=2528010 RepID=A0A518DX24_9BACT|nr:SDR family oxidoreductase [Lignipirellula cremea]QDU96382.1 3-oxoacyl-[acyl-carrier-protein] reductase FabG [Lignipirellula cremea]
MPNNLKLSKDSSDSSADGRFAGKTFLITGGSDRGIGGAVAERLAKEGARIAIASLHEPARLMRKLARLTTEAAFFPCDITDNSQVKATVAAVAEKFGQLDTLVNNAGVEIARPFEEFTEDQWEGLLDVNLHGAIRMTRACLPHLANGGVIVNVTSALAFGGCASFSIYSASKAGLVGLTQSLAMELSPRKIRVVCVAPGLVATPMTYKHIDHLDDDAKRQIADSHPLGPGLPHDVAAAIAFLASDDARWITGVTLPLGWLQQYRLPVDHFLKAA